MNKKNIPYGRQSIDQSDIDEVVAVLRSDWLTQGPVVPCFETAIANCCKVEHAVAVNSATSALHIACLALGVEPGNYVWTVPNTFVASANCALYCGAIIDFVDIDISTGNISIVALEDKLEIAKKVGTLPKVVIAIDFAGRSCEMKQLNQLGQKYGFAIIEDASHAIGGFYQNKPIGCCEFSDITIFSFHPVKIITTAEGGMALTRSKILANKLRLLRSHGVTRDIDKMDFSLHGDWYYQQKMLGFNYRMTDIQAALGLSQLKRLSTFIQVRKNLVHYYNELFKKQGLPVCVPYPDSQGNVSAWHLYVIRVDKAIRKMLFDYLRHRGVFVNVHYIPVHTQPYYQHLGFKWGDFPNAEEHYATAITLPLYADLGVSDAENIVQLIQQFYGESDVNSFR